MAPRAASETVDHSLAHESVESRLYSTSKPPRVSTLEKLCFRTTDAARYPRASNVEKNIPVYDCTKLDIEDAVVQDEWYDILLKGPGVFVLKNMYQDVSVIERANVALEAIIARERGKQNGDHFAARGNNDRIWNSFRKHCSQDPQNFIRYYSNIWLAKVCEAWLGPGYRITAQTNIVKPGGGAQVSHRDYHLGFQTEESCSRIPKAMHMASQLLTVQGAVAHSDMPLQSGPTRFLPFSQLMEDGFMAYRRPEFNDFFLDNYVSLPLELGDGVFFNPALMHAAGENRTKDFSRSANLIQVSSAFGKPMESINTIGIAGFCWYHILDEFKAKGWTRELEAIVAAIGEGYPFPTNLDRRPPAPGGMAPMSEQGLLRQSLELEYPRDSVTEALWAMRCDSQDVLQDSENYLA